MVGFDAVALDRHICDGPANETRTVDVDCLGCGEEFEATAVGDTGTVLLDPERCPGCSSSALAVVS